MKKYVSLVLAFVLMFSVLAFSGCTKNNNDSDKDTENNSSVDSATGNPVATITVKDYGVMKVELYPDKAPNTVKNFISLANKAFYDGLTFHRVYKGFMIQGGCPDGTGGGDPGYSIKGEFSGNGVENDLAHTRGVISMARSKMPDSAGSQFFIMHEDAPHLDGQYAAFGKVIEGLDVLDKIADAEVTLNMSSGEMSTPVNKIIIESISVDTFGVNYAEPETLN
ncbi:MAG: peptidylprolyl isomerase [Clostridia bacterium]|nr:peptidylprolyl isomerase [Clostridia bacterium]